MEAELLRSILFSFGGNPIFAEVVAPGPQYISSIQPISVRGRLRGNVLGLSSGVDTEESEISRSSGVGRRSKELKEAEVRAEVEEDDLSV